MTKSAICRFGNDQIIRPVQAQAQFVVGFTGRVLKKKGGERKRKKRRKRGGRERKKRRKRSEREEREWTLCDCD